MLMLMRMKLDLGEGTLGDPFKIPLTLTINIIRFLSDQRVLNNTKLSYFQPTEILHSIIDAIEHFIQSLS